MPEGEYWKPASAEILENLKRIEAGLKSLRQLCACEPDYAVILPQLRSLMHSLDIASKLLQQRYLAKHLFNSNGPDPLHPGVDCLAEICGRVLQGRTTALRKEQKNFTSGNIPTRGKGIKNGAGGAGDKR